MKDKLPSARFRKQLKTELPILQSEGLLSAEQAEALSHRYGLGSLASETTHALLTAIYILGTVLVGIGIISFVAAHWMDMSREIKLVLIVGAMLAAHAGGFYLWKVRGNYPKLGHALVLLGTLIFGANIGLIAQIFHISDNPYNGFAAWAAGAVVIAWAVQSVPNAVVALITAGIFAFGNLIEGQADLVAWFPLIAAAVFVPLVYYLRSLWVLWLTLLLLAFFMPFFAAQYGDECYGFAAAASLMGLLLFCWGLAGWKVLSHRFISVPAWIVGLFMTALPLYLSSFLDYSDEMIRHGLSAILSKPHAVLIPAAVFLLLILGLLAFSTPVLKKRLLCQFVILAAASFPAVCLLPLLASSFVLIIAAHILLILLIGLLFYSSRALEDRRLFWVSVLLAALLVLSRTLEYETSLLIKAAAFIACGIGLIIAGVCFERYLKTRRQNYD